MDRGAARPAPDTPENRAWVAAQMAKVTDGSIWPEIAAQPSPEEIVRSHLASRA